MNELNKFYVNQPQTYKRTHAHSDCIDLYKALQVHCLREHKKSNGIKWHQMVTDEGKTFLDSTL